MPKIYRAMFAADRLPEVGDWSCMLGVRTPPHDHTDITPDEFGNVSPNTGGMSVNPTVSDIPLSFKPKRWRHQYPEYKDARGKDNIEVFTYGSGEFTQAHITVDLALQPDSTTHGVVEPSRSMQIDIYRSALVATQPGWQLLIVPDGS